MIKVPVGMWRARLSWCCVRHVHGASRALQQHTTEPMPFEVEFAASHVAVSGFQRALLAAGSAAVSLLDPSRADAIAILGETAGHSAVRHMLRRMESHPEGREILSQRPRINSKTVDLPKLEKMPDGTLGKTYWNFLSSNKVTPDSRLMVQFVDDVNMGYVIQRYREVHDLVHTLLHMPTNMLGEVTVKWVEALQTRLPMCIGGALFGAMRLAPKQRRSYTKHYLPWAIQTGSTAEFLMNVYYEKRWEQPVEDLCRELRVQPLALPHTV
ncbi:ubiquinone biosynthesis protein COQ4 homolog, mitochondrial isoform X2 [Bacillus rossius redtenbacheri]|uniref:ubiquinone biosynthesis protein COQ4 homolog, mitochondrial isoform X2 n=1 Tax=Bacillus rossius redtenbacheri TaxID=93214 RepID=UPI002FDD7B67